MRALNRLDISGIEFCCLDDRLLFARLGETTIGRNVTLRPNFSVLNILNELITVVHCEGPLGEVIPAIVTITDEYGNQIKNWKFHCRRLDVSLNFFDKGYWVTIQVGNHFQRMPLSWDQHKHKIIPHGATFH